MSHSIIIVEICPPADASQKEPGSFIWSCLSLRHLLRSHFSFSFRVGIQLKLGVQRHFLSRFRGCTDVAVNSSPVRCRICPESRRAWRPWDAGSWSARTRNSSRRCDPEDTTPLPSVPSEFCKQKTMSMTRTAPEATEAENNRKYLSVRIAGVWCVFYLPYFCQPNSKLLWQAHPHPTSDKSCKIPSEVKVSKPSHRELLQMKLLQANRSSKCWMQVCLSNLIIPNGWLRTLIKMQLGLKSWKDYSRDHNPNSDLGRQESFERYIQSTLGMFIFFQLSTKAKGYQTNQ